MGITHKQHYDLYKNGVDIVDDDMVISENIYNDYEVTLKLDIKEALQAFKRITPRRSLDSYLQLSANQVKFDDKMSFYNLNQSENETAYTF